MMRLLAAIVCLFVCDPVRGDEFFIRDGDRVVFLGDSITEQGKPGELEGGGLYTVYVEAYALTRYPTWKLSFRNVGIGGDAATLSQRQAEPVDRKALLSNDDGLRRRTIERMVAAGLQRDVLPLRPTLVTVAYGMNDFGYQAFNEANFRRFVEAEQELIDRLKASRCRIALVTPQPIESLPGRSDRNEPEKNGALLRFAAGLKDLAVRNDVGFVDRFESYRRSLERARAAAPPRFVGGGLDAVHPGPPGHAIMAWAMLKQLGAPALVSSAEIDAARKTVVMTNRCRVSEISLEADGTLRFVRSDEALPMPLDPRAEPAREWVPLLDDLNRYLLKVTGLPAAKYDLLIDDELAATVDRAQLAEGWNMAVAAGPIATQSLGVMRLVMRKNGAFFRRWKEIQLTPTRLNELPSADRRLAELEAEIEAARRVRPHSFTLRPRD